ncbi:FAD dependent oxidoreductase [Roseibium sp. TrichSKD4]|uniref:NAD(P)/FAD-dependent oxidoreductase n=1 Tax=Roseibium sp. TrichSKD4 TaxID=744980 RepID=UPI0001E574BE|nr:FAD-dependent oxidoreductase [Roseibium sp. TrichSKD4]EFO29301.1 FAD dependent oxidoreductase [Roseibium sp. TrichSKD4]
MTRPIRIGIIGAGMTGLACARKLADAGHEPLLLDKGRGIGGRLATRRAENDLQFDHGAQYITAKTDGFQRLLAELTANCAASEWHMGDRTGVVGTPSMNALAKALADGLTIRRQTQVTSVMETGSTWSVSTGDGTLEFDRLIITAPAPQTMALLGNDHPLSKQIAHVSLLPCWTLMVAFDKAPALAATYHDPDAPLAWIAQESTKPGRANKNTFVAQASPYWSQIHLELDKPAATDLMLTELCKVWASIGPMWSTPMRTAGATPKSTPLWARLSLPTRRRPCSWAVTGASAPAWKRHGKAEPALQRSCWSKCEAVGLRQ